MYQYLGNTGIKMYDIFNLISVIALLIMNMSMLKQKTEFLSAVSLRHIKRCRRKNKPRFVYNRYTVAFVEMFLISLVQYGFVSIFTMQFGKIMDTGRNYFSVLYFVPCLLMLLFYIIKISPIKQFDMITPAYAIALVFAKIACFCSGCCNGIECEYGFYNANSGLKEFPVQLAEAAIVLFIFIFLLIYRKKAKNGTLFPVFLITYSAARFFLEFLRHEENIFLIFKTYHILCIIGILLGIAEYYIAVKYGEKIIKFYNNRKIKDGYFRSM